MLAAFFADAVKRGVLDQLIVSEFDIVGAFLNNALNHLNSPLQLVMRLPDDLPHPLAGQWVEIVKALYGLKQSNNIFDTDFVATLAKGNFFPTAADPRIFVRRHPTDSTIFCAVAMHVDDGLICSFSAEFRDDLITLLRERYGAITYNPVCTNNTGYSISREPDGAVVISQVGYIQRMLSDLAATNLPPTDNCCSADLFAEPSDPTLYDAHAFRHIVGCLIFCLRTRHDIRTAVQFLTSRMATPTVSCYQKALRVLAYLNTWSHLGARYYTTEGPQLYVYTDASYGVHADGRSQTGFYICIGRHSAPVYSYAGRQTSCVSTGSMESEYVALTKAVKKCMHYRQLLSDLGFSQTAPTVIFEDNKSAITLATAPEITKNAKHIHTRHHYIRDVVAQGLFVLQHLPTADQVADIFTKPLPKKTFLLLRAKLMNLDSKLAPSSCSLTGEC
jgi:hypothetical protein